MAKLFENNYASFFGGYCGYAGTDHEFLTYPPRISPSAGTAGTPIYDHELSIAFIITAKKIVMNLVMSDIQKYDEAVNVIKTAILQSQYDAARSVNEKQLMLYYGIGKYISANSRNGAWGSGAIDTISEQLQKELPGLRGFSARNLRNMRMFYEEWSYYGDSQAKQDAGELAVATARIYSDEAIWQLQLPNSVKVEKEPFVSIGFTHHITILMKVKDYDERI